MKSSPQTPHGCPATGTQAHDMSRELEFGRPAHVGATPVADQPREPLRGEVDQVSSAVAEVTNLNQDLTFSRQYGRFQSPKFMVRGRAVIIGAGIIGQAHALTALEAGWSVTILERDGRPLGASVRNFGTVLPLACTFGLEREQALFGIRRWSKLAETANFWTDRGGALGLAYREEAWGVLQEFFSSAPTNSQFELLTPTEVKHRFPAANCNGLQGALFSQAEVVVHSVSALAALTRLIQERGGSVHFNSPAVKIHDGAVETADTRKFEFDRLVIAAGDEMNLFFPEALRNAQLARCRLQMMRTVPQSPAFKLGAIFLSDLTMGYYPVFSRLPSWQALRARLDSELPACRRWGIHVLAVQHPDGSVVIGDSHEYGQDFEPYSHPEVDDLILTELNRFVRVPDIRLAARWQGIYLKSVAGKTQVVLNPRPNITMVTAMGGLGMTLCWGLAQETLRRWTDT